MKLVVLAVRDATVGAFMRPMFVQSVAQGIRSFGDEVNRVADDNLMYKHPQDFTLWMFGDFDDSEHPHFDLLDTPDCVAKAVDLRVPDSVRK